MEIVFDVLKVLKKVFLYVVVVCFGISCEEVVNELWEFKRNGVVDKIGYIWFLVGEGEFWVIEEWLVKFEVQDMLIGEVE